MVWFGAATMEASCEEVQRGLLALSNQTVNPCHGIDDSLMALS